MKRREQEWASLPGDNIGSTPNSSMSVFVNLKPANELDASQVPELLIKAVSESFDGELMLTTHEGQQVALRFAKGVLVRSLSAYGRRALIAALSEQLPAEQIALAEAHAREHQVDEFTAVERLLLLPPLSLARLLQDCLQRELLQLVQHMGTLHYRFQASPPQSNQAAVPPQGIEPLILISETLLESSYLSRCRELLQPSFREQLVLQGRVLNPQVELRGHLRQVVSSLRRQPESLENLRLRRVASEPALVAVVYALRATGCISLEDKAEAARATYAPPSAGLGAVRRASTSGVREIALPGQEARPMGAASGHPAAQAFPPSSTASMVPPGSFAPSSLGANTRGPGSAAPQSNSATPSSRSLTPASRATVHVDEHLLEQSALDAWMRAVDNRALAKKALKIAERSAARAPRNPAILYYYGCLLSLNANYLEAEVALRRVLNFEPDHAEARQELAKIEKIQKGPEKQGLLGRWVGRKS